MAGTVRSRRTWCALFLVTAALAPPAYGRYAQASRVVNIDGVPYRLTLLSNATNDGTMGTVDYAWFVSYIEQWKYHRLKERGLLDPETERRAEAAIRAGGGPTSLGQLTMQQALSLFEPMIFHDEILILSRLGPEPPNHPDHVRPAGIDGEIVAMFAMDRLGQVDDFFRRLIARHHGPDFESLLLEERLGIRLPRPESRAAEPPPENRQHWHPSLRGAGVTYREGDVVQLNGLVIDKRERNITPAHLYYLALLHGWFTTGRVTEDASGKRTVHVPTVFVGEGIGARGVLYRGLGATPQADTAGRTEWPDPNVPGSRVQVLGVDGDSLRAGPPERLASRIDPDRVELGPIVLETYDDYGEIVRRPLESDPLGCAGGYRTLAALR